MPSCPPLSSTSPRTGTQAFPYIKGEEPGKNDHLVPPLCKGRSGGVEPTVHGSTGGRRHGCRLYLPSPLLTKEGNL